MLELYGLEPRAARRGYARSDAPRRSWRSCATAALTADELVRATALDPGRGAAALMELELAGRVTLEDGVYRAAV